MLQPSPVAQDVEAAPADACLATSGFVHLHLHSEYSFLDGGNRLGALVDRVLDLGMDAVALTDHGNLHGAVEFYRRARKRGVKPILGIEAYVAAGDRRERVPGTTGQGGDHLVLLAENEIGWRNLLRLSSDSFLNGFYYRPRMDKSTLAEWSEGLIAINGHLGSSLAGHLLQYEQTGNEAHYEAALEEARWHRDTFGTNAGGAPCFFVELQRNGVSEQDRINPHLMRLARELDLPLVCDNDVHYLKAESYDDHDSLCCISMGKTKDDPSRLHYSRQLFLKSPQEMTELFADVPEAIENTVRIARRCNVELDLDASHAPMVKILHPGEPPSFDGGDATVWFKAYCARFELVPFDAEQDRDLPLEQVRADCDRALRDLCEAGLVWRYGTEGVTPEIRTRLDRELRILADKMISAYFLIVWDFVNWARQNDIPANARGSGVGTMVGYVLGLSNACPVRYGLLFERFTDPDRSEYPDIDIDICQDGRAAVIGYVRRKYGHVAQIITFGRLKAKAAIKDVARVMGLAPAEGQRLANLVPNELNITLDAALEKEPDFKAQYDTDPTVRRVVDTARSLEEHARHTGVHAAGVVIATQPLDNIVPLCKASGSDDAVTQWDGPTCEQLGLLKMDFLGLRTLSTIERARLLVRQTLDEEAIRAAVGNAGERHPLDLDRLPYDDQRVFDLFRRGDTAGVFQFESPGMRKLLLQMQPDRLEDLIAANALFRPGPMDLIPDYCERKHGRQAVPTAHSIIRRHTEETYGIMVYQEQVMQIVHELGDIPLRSAYTLIKAISKKKKSVIDAERPKFIDGAKAKGVSPREANELFDLILKFAGYGFNKSHSTGYAIIAYQTAYLKTYYPNQYMAALLTFESAARKVDDWVPYLEDCRHTVFPDSRPQQPHVGVEVRPPDINLSDQEFAVVFEPDEPRDALHGHVRFGLGAIKGAGRAAIAAIIEERDKSGPFSSIFDFSERVSSRTVNKATVEALVKCGAFDSVHGAPSRAAVFASIDDAIAAGVSAAEDRRAGQLNMFAGDLPEATPEAPPARPLPSVPAWDRLTVLDNEKQVLGFHVSGHPLDEHDPILQHFCTATTSTLAQLPNDTVVILGAILNQVAFVVSRRGRNPGQRMARITAQDKVGSVEAVCFPEAFARCGSALRTGEATLLIGRVDHTRGEPQVVVENAMPIDHAERQLARDVDIELVDGADLEQRLQLVAGLLQSAHAGRVQSDGRPAGVILHLRTGDKRVSMRSSRMRVVAEPHLLLELRRIAGPENVRVLSSGPPKLAAREPWRRRG